MASRVLVTGGAGFIGCHTVTALLEKGYDVRVLDSLAPPVHADRTPPAWFPSQAELIVGDVRNRDDVAHAVSGITGIVHLAAYQDYLPDFSTFFDVNSVGTAMLYEALVTSRQDIDKVVIASSQASYGEGLHMCPTHGPQHPDIRPDTQLRLGRWDLGCPECGRPMAWQKTTEHRVNPQNQYGLSKWTQELIGFSLGRRYAIPTTCLRYSITQGKWQSPRNAYSGICRIFTIRALARKNPIVFEDGNQLRDYVYVGDVAQANVLALEDHRTDFEPYNVGGNEPISALRYAQIVLEMLDSKAAPELPGLYRFGDTRHMVSDVTKLEALGWRQSLRVPEIVSQYAEWLEQAGLTDDVTDRSLDRMLELGTVRRPTTAWQPSTPGESTRRRRRDRD